MKRTVFKLCKFGGIFQSAPFVSRTGVEEIATLAQPREIVKMAWQQLPEYKST
jgi:hypothetical protein